jgi:hypothetical protein
LPRGGAPDWSTHGASFIEKLLGKTFLAANCQANHKIRGGLTMPDGKRKRRFSLDQSKRQWYADHRARRFRKRFGLDTKAGFANH